MRGKADFLTNGYSNQLIQKIFDSYSAKVFLNPYDLLVLRKFVPTSPQARFIANNKLKLVGPTVTVSFITELIEDSTRANGSLRFEEKHPEYKLLFIDDKLPSNRIQLSGLLTEGGEYLAL